ncbi:MAG: carbohydrate ABC transporter permease [Trueperaceae bacterium]|nr:carbohydrate ABC transporter permease [Trueperaceae bacterium]
MFFPIYWMLATTVMPREEAYSRDLLLFPKTLVFDNYVNGWTQSPWLRWYGNTLLIVGVSVFGLTIFSLLAGFAFAKYTFRGRNFFFLLILSTLMIPLQVLLIPRFLLVAKFDWVNTYWSVIGPHMADSFGLFFVRQFMLDMPDELLEAARIDGAGELTIFRRIVLPLSKPAIAVLIILGVTARWNAFAWPLVALTKKDMYTVQLGINFMKGYYATDFPAIISMVALSIIPIVVVFLVFQRYFIQGITRTGIK